MAEGPVVLPVLRPSPVSVIPLTSLTDIRLNTTLVNGVTLELRHSCTLLAQTLTALGSYTRFPSSLSSFPLFFCALFLYLSPCSFPLFAIIPSTPNPPNPISCFSSDYFNTGSIQLASFINHFSDFYLNFAPNTSAFLYTFNSEEWKKRQRKITGNSFVRGYYSGPRQCSLAQVVYIL